MAEPLAMSVDEAHQYIGGDRVISRGAFYKAVKAGEIPSVKVGKRILIPRAKFKRWVAMEIEPVKDTYDGEAL